MNKTTQTRKARQTADIDFLSNLRRSPGQSDIEWDVLVARAQVRARRFRGAMSRSPEGALTEADQIELSMLCRMMIEVGMSRQTMGRLPPVRKKHLPEHRRKQGHRAAGDCTQCFAPKNKAHKMSCYSGHGGRARENYLQLRLDEANAHLELVIAELKKLRLKDISGALGTAQQAGIVELAWKACDQLWHGMREHPDPAHPDWIKCVQDVGKMRRELRDVLELLALAEAVEKG